MGKAYGEACVLAHVVRPANAKPGDDATGQRVHDGK